MEQVKRWNARYRGGITVENYTPPLMETADGDYILYSDCEALRAENERLRAAATAFVEKLEVIHGHPEYKAVWSSAFVHRGDYHGPNYQAELSVLKAALAPKQGEPIGEREDG